MAKRKPTRPEIAELLQAERGQLREQAELHEGTRGLDARKRQFLIAGRKEGLWEATDLLWTPERWTPTTRREVHAAIVARVQEVLAQREEVYQEARADNFPEWGDVAWAHEAGKVDSLMATAAALYGDRSLLRHLHVIEHPEQARQRPRDRERGPGLGD